MADGSVTIAVTADDKPFREGLSKLGGIAKSGLAAVGTAVTAVGAGLAAAGGAAVAVGSEFETALAKTSTMFGNVQVDIDGLSDKIISLSNSTGLASSEIGESLYNALSAGIPVTKDMDAAMGFMEKSAKLAKAGFTDVDTAVTSTAKILNAYKLDVSETDKVHKILMQTQNKGITTVGELGASLAQVTPTAAAMNVSFEQVGAALASMTAQGTPTAQATTQLNSLLAELGKNGTQASKMLAASTEGTQYAGRGFQQLVADGVPLNEILDVMAGYASNNNKSLLDMFSSIEGGKAALALSGQNAQQFTDNLAAMGTGADVVSEAYDKVSDTLQTAMQKFKANAANLGIEFYQSIDNPLKDVVDQATTYMGQLSQAFKSGGLEGLAQAIGDTLADAASRIVEFAPQLLDAASVVIQAFLTGLISNMPRVVEAAGSIINAIVSSVGAIIPALVEAGVAILQALAQGILDNLPAILDSALAIADVLVSGLNDLLPSLIETGSEIIVQLASGLAQALPELIPAAVDAILTIVESILDNIDLLIDAALQLIMALADGLIKAVPKLIEKAPTIVQKLVDGIVKNVPKIIKAADELILELVKALIANAPQLIKASIEIIGSLVAGLISYIGNLGKAAMELVKKIWDTFTQTDWLSVGKNIIDGIISGVSSMIRNLVDTVKKAASRALDAVKSFFGINSPSKKMALEVGGPMAQGMAVGFEDNVAKAYQDMQAAVNGETLRLSADIGTRVGLSINAGVPSSTSTATIGSLIGKAADVLVIREDADIDRIARQLQRRTMDAARGLGVNLAW